LTEEGKDTNTAFYFSHVIVCTRLKLTLIPKMFSTYFVPIIHSVFLTQKSHGGRFAIAWQDGAAACQPITVNRPSRDFRVRKTLLIIGFNDRERVKQLRCIINYFVTITVWHV